jgi:hypothetical protein
LWNGLPGVDPASKVGNRETLLNRLWSTLGSLPDPLPARGTKRAEVIALLRRPEGATVDEVRTAHGLTPHTVGGGLFGRFEEEARSWR